MVRRGRTPSAFRIRIASIVVAMPSALSVAPVAGVPRVEVRAEHHDLVLERVVGARDLGDYVVRVAILVVEARLHFDCQLDRDLLLQHPRDQVVVLGRQDDRGHRVGAHVAAGDEHGAVLADVGLDRDADAFGLERREPLGVQLRRAHRGRLRRLQIAGRDRPIGLDGVGHAPGSS